MRLMFWVSRKLHLRSAFSLAVMLNFLPLSQTWEGALNRTWPTAPLRIHDYVVTPDLKRVIAIAILNETKHDAHGTKPVASRSPDRTISDGLGLAGQPISIGKMDRHIVIYDFDTGKIIRSVKPSASASSAFAVEMLDLKMLADFSDSNSVVVTSQLSSPALPSRTIANIFC